MGKRWITIIVILILVITIALVIFAIRQNDSPKEITFSKFLEMSPSEQQAYMESYGDIEAFLTWYRLAEEEYKAEHKEIEIGGDGIIDIGGYLN